MGSARCMLSVIKRAALKSQCSLLLFMLRLCVFSVEARPCSSPHTYSASRVETLCIASNAVQPQDVAELTVLLLKFPALASLDVSANPEMGNIGVVALLSSLSGMRFVFTICCVG
jgi:hypothetical protein